MIEVLIFLIVAIKVTTDKYVPAFMSPG